MENWIGAYRLPNQTASLGVDRGGGGGGGGEGSLEGGVSPIPGSTPSPNLLNMWNHAIKVETSSHGLPGSHPSSQGGSIKGEDFLIRIVFSIFCGGRRLSSLTRTNLFCGREELFVADDHLLWSAGTRLSTSGSLSDHFLFRLANRIKGILG